MPGLGAASPQCDDNHHELLTEQCMLAWQEAPAMPSLRFPLLASSFAVCRGIGDFPTSPCPRNIGYAEHQKAQLGMDVFPVASTFSGPSCNRLKVS